MKKFYIIFAVTLFAASISCSHTTGQAKNDENGPKIEFAIIEFDYGTITQGSDGKCEFEFTNKGNEALVLSNVQSTCGCTVPSWPKEPVKAGEKSKIVVVYNTSRPGPINKSIMVSSNATSNAIVLKIKGNVVPKPEAKEEAKAN
ncbi:MAG: DUF1573 domain-containing protein [Bacteroidales bacterium]